MKVRRPLAEWRQKAGMNLRVTEREREGEGGSRSFSHTAQPEFHDCSVLRPTRIEGEGDESRKRERGILISPSLSPLRFISSLPSLSEAPRDQPTSNRGAAGLKTGVECIICVFAKEYVQWAGIWNRGQVAFDHALPAESV